MTLGTTQGRTEIILSNNCSIKHVLIVSDAVTNTELAVPVDKIYLISLLSSSYCTRMCFNIGIVVCGPNEALVISGMFQVRW